MNKLTKILVALACTAACNTLVAGQDVSETRSVDADAFISVSNAVGEVRISSWDSNEVSIEGTLADNVEELVIEGGGKYLEIEVKNPKRSRRLDDSYLTLKVPAGASIEVESISADIYIDDLAGEVMSAASVSGDVEVNADSQRVEIESVSGDISFAGSATETQVESVSGEIDLTGVSGELGAATVSGDIYIRSGEISGGQFETVSGELDITTALSSDARLSVESLSGDVNLTFPASVSARFEASSFSGDISSDFGDSNNSGPGSSLEFSTGDGSARVRVESFSADIEINSN